MVRVIKTNKLMGSYSLLFVTTLLLNQIQFGWGSGNIETSNNKPHGPNAEPGNSLATNSAGLRNRFPTHFQQKSSQDSSSVPSSGNSPGVKILEALSSSPRILKSNPATPANKSTSGTVQVKSTGDLATKAESRMGRADYDEEDQDAYENNETMESDEGILVSPFGKPVFSKRRSGNGASSHLPGPVYSYGSNNNYNQYGGGGRPKPTVMSYKPTGGSGQVTMKPIIFPPVVNPIPTMPPGEIIQPPSPGSVITPEPTTITTPTSGPVGPPSPTIVPIIGGGSPGGSPGGEEDIFPPSPPEIESVGRSLLLRSSPRTKLSSKSSREGKSTNGGISPGFRRASSPVTGSPGVASLSRTAGSAAAAVATPKSIGNNSGGRIRTTRLRDRVRESLEESSKSQELDGKDSSEDPENLVDSDVITDFAFEDIRCFKTRTKEYFGATIHMKRGFHQPYVRDRPQDPLTSNDCRMELKPGTKATFHMTVTDLRGCGVEQCGDFMCLTMVFPRVPTLALADDEVTTIKCLPQKSTMADTRTISFAGDTLENRKSSSTVEGGGQDFAAEVGVFRQNPGASNGLFVKRVNSGGVVQLGEPLQLRSIVRGGDGWKHSRLSDVKVWRMRDSASVSNVDNLDPNDASEVITLVDGRGCRNDEYAVIADSHPLKDPRNDLVNHFTFKAFLFRGQRANEPLILTAKVHACQEDEDCTLDDCDGSNPSGRKRRSPVELHNSSAIIHDWDSRMALRVVGLKDHPASLTEEDFPLSNNKIEGGHGRSLGDDDFPGSCAEKMAVSGLGGGLVVLLLCGISLALYAYTVKGRDSRRDSNKGNFSPVMIGGRPSMMNQPQQIHQQRILPQGGLFPDGMKINKPLPPTPSNNNPEPPQHQQSSSSSSSPEPDHLSKTELSNVAKMLQKLAEKSQQKSSKKVSNNEPDQTDYECIDETSNKQSSKKGKDGVYIVYCCNDEKGGAKKLGGVLKRPKSAPASLRDKRKNSKKDQKKNRKKVSPEVYCSPTEGDSSQSSETPSEESDASSSSSSSTDPNNNSRAFANRRTVRSVKVKSRSTRQYSDNAHHGHHNRSASERKGSNNKVVSGIRRRLSSFYRDNGGIGFKRESRRQQKEMRRRLEGGSDGGGGGGTLMSSDLDSAYYGSEFNDDVLQEMRQLAVQHQMQQQQQHLQGQVGHVENQLLPLGLPETQFRRNTNKEHLVASVKEQLRNPGTIIGHQYYDGTPSSSATPGPISPPLEPGQTKAAHFVTRNESSTQILIVPETHV